jgi:hypothetical protein
MEEVKKYPSIEEFYKFADGIDDLDDTMRDTLQESGLYTHNLQKESYPYIAMHNSMQLYNVFQTIFNLKKVMEVSSKFQYDLTDIGAGTGRIVKLAKFFGLKARGLEYHEPYTKLGRTLFDLSADELIVGNAFDVSKKYVQESFVIYTYMPLHNHDRMSELHFSLYSKAKTGSWFVEMLPRYYPMNIAGVQGFKNQAPGFVASCVPEKSYFGLTRRIAQQSWEN